MAITAANIQQNPRAVAFTFTGDGTSTSITVPFPSHILYRPNHTAKAYVLSGTLTGYDVHSGRGGLRTPIGGTPVTVSSCVVSKTGITVTTSAAVGNAVAAFCTVVFDQAMD